MENTIEVPADMTDKDIREDPHTAEIFDGAKSYSVEIEPDSIEVYGVSEREEK